MKRSTFVAGLLGCLGIGKAQRWKECVRAEGNPHLCTGKDRPALPNQCPVCGTMAAPYKRPTHTGPLKNCRISGDNALQCDPAEQIPYGEPERITRCRRCNAAFFQDAEDGGRK